MNTQIPSGAHEDDVFQSTDTNSAFDNDDLLPEEFVLSDANDEGADTEVEAKQGLLSSKKYRWLAALVFLTTIICIFAAGGSIKAAIDQKRLEADGVQVSYGDYPVNAAGDDCVENLSATSKSSKAPSASKSSKKSKSKSSKPPSPSKSSKCPGNGQEPDRFR